MKENRHINRVEKILYIKIIESIKKIQLKRK